ncbi:acireductone synthase [Kitasatospora sp. MAP5-34]|uniref:acireductone synthase n=1 Tax=Kitasatospora sp. MAP5-34 TaxID=3035102 RepID=UPI002477156C|nr:acireductone synthase [Kitasatospora sp. MAP5-34]MDH6576339.1 enolase-phosphatase E1 [Kitasatospora sp. MAP5-34]
MTVPRAVVLDIEGTTGSIDHVHQVLFPYARRRLAGWLDTHRGSARHQELLDAVRSHRQAPGLDEPAVLRTLAEWADADVKAAPLKALQGLIWAEGFADGSLSGHVYPEVPPVLREWHQAGIALYIYSSGAAGAQRDWFAHSGHGDLTPLLQGYFDLESAGGKRAAGSYRTIASAIGLPAGQLLFLSDVGEELDAARSAGWRAVGVRRPGDPRGAEITGHPTVAALDRVRFDVPQTVSPAVSPAGSPTVPPNRAPKSPAKEGQQ